MKTLAAVLHAIDAPLRMQELTIPDLRAGQVLVEIAFSGVCHTQLHELRGRKGPDRFLPHALGHEGSGRVVAIGEGVTKVAPGDHVVLSWIKGRGAEVPGTQYQGEGSTVNSGAVCTFMRTTVVSENRLCPIPHNMPLREAALLGCAIPTGAGIVTNTLGIQAGKSLVIFGAGGIGLAALLAARHAGATPIAVVDIVAEKLALACELGATHAIDARAGDPLAALHAILPKGFDFAIEAAGRKETMEASVAAIRPFGGVAVLAGNLTVGQKIEIDPFDLIRGKRVIGTWGGETDTDLDIPRYAAMFMDSGFPIDRLITRTYPLEAVNEALADLEGGRVARAMIDMQATV